ncbi:unnamed protein product [Trichogramma brassicae]|uniref:Uncharacterized protein n=1 Tax=Trichogramma brassicae TaxID=86971 RepID=A0A6H5IVJ0_9HYME|nr:unnamed protein product [Trichogramma brassicae]
MEQCGALTTNRRVSATAPSRGGVIPRRRYRGRCQSPRSDSEKRWEGRWRERCSKEESEQAATQEEREVCNKKGHYARECTQKESSRSSTSNDEGNVALVVSINKNSGSSNTQVSNETKQILAADVKDIWLTDSGASEHMRSRREWFVDYRPRKDGSTVSLGDDHEYEIVGVGTIIVKRLVNDEWRNGRIENVLHVPGMKKNLLSVGVCVKKGFDVSFKKNAVYIQMKNETYAFGILQSNNTYRMIMRVVNKTADKQANVATSLQCLHERLGHLNTRALKELVDKKLIRGVELSDRKNFFCESCQLGKSHRQPFVPRKEKIITKPGEFVHSDVSGPMSEDQ